MIQHIPSINDAMEVKGQTTLDNNTIDDLNDMDRKQVINKLMQMYRLNDSSSEHKEKIFFTVSDINTIYINNKDYKNIEDVPKLLAKLHKDGYLGKLEDKYRKYNIYYLTKKTEQINKAIGKLTKKQIIEASNYLNNINFMINNN